VKSKLKITRFFSFTLLYEMISFSVWSLIETLLIWLNSWSDAFIVGSTLSIYYLGIYRTSMNTVNSIMAIITGATTSILYSALSRLQNNESAFSNTFFKFQRIVSCLILPLGAGIYIYRDLITDILLGSQWKESSLLIGMWGLTSAIVIVFAHFCSEIYRAKGKPKISSLVQLLHLVALIPVIYFAVQADFSTLVYSRTLVRLQIVVVNFIFMYIYVGISPWKMIINVFPPILCTITMCGFALVMQSFSSSTLWSILSIIICGSIYVSLLLLFPNIRKEILSILRTQNAIKING
jgi:O-antigen/teichoic acid export membrane protein